MPLVISYEHAKTAQFHRRGALRTPFLNAAQDLELPESPAHNVKFPVAFLSQGSPARVNESHYHLEDEFLLVTEGSGMLGRRTLAPYTVFFARAYTPYGPLVGDRKTGIGFFVLSARFETGAQYIPEKTEDLKRMSDRRPWQIARQVHFANADANPSTAVQLQTDPDIQDDRGLFVCTLTMAPNARIATPDASSGDGQFLIVVKGSLWQQNIEHRAYTVVFIEPKDASFDVRAGAEGLEAIIMNFPRPLMSASVKSMVQSEATAKAAPSSPVVARKWQCELCAFSYDENRGLPEDGIPPGTRWEDIPTDWTCPDCGTSKGDFRFIDSARA